MIASNQIVCLSCALLVSGVSAWAGDNGSPGLASLHGATRSADGLPIPGVHLTAHRIEDNSDSTVTSGADGTFTVDELKPGQYRISASKPGFVGLPITLQLSARETTHVEFPLEVAGTSVESALLKGLESMQRRLDQMEAELQQMKAKSEAQAAKENDRRDTAPLHRWSLRWSPMGATPATAPSTHSPQAIQPGTKSHAATIRRQGEARWLP